jgi:hypothetical protein
VDVQLALQEKLLDRLGKHPAAFGSSTSTGCSSSSELPVKGNAA